MHIHRCSLCAVFEFCFVFLFFRLRVTSNCLMNFFLTSFRDVRTILFRYGTALFLLLMCSFEMNLRWSVVYWIEWNNFIEMNFVWVDVFICVCLTDCVFIGVDLIRAFVWMEINDKQTQQNVTHIWIIAHTLKHHTYIHTNVRVCEVNYVILCLNWARNKTRPITESTWCMNYIVCCAVLLMLMFFFCVANKKNNTRRNSISNSKSSGSSSNNNM